MKAGRIDDYTKTLPIVELYYAIQSEGSRAGRPTVVIRTTGCTHRCYFGEGGFCDSWYTSIHPEKGKYSFADIMSMYHARPDITEMMLTGGSPTMHPELVNELTHYANAHNITITMETEGSEQVETEYPIGLISLSPKFSNSVPVLGIKTPKGKVVDQRMIDQHNKFRLKIDVMREMITYHEDYQLKPVWDGEDMAALAEIEDLIKKLKIPKSKVWFMPAGDTREQLIKVYPKVMKFCTDSGYNFTGREHIIAFDVAREV